MTQPTPLNFAFVFVLFAVLPCGMEAFPYGPPTTACESMFPTGHNAAAQTVASPFSFNFTDSLSFRANDYIPVTLMTTDSGEFEGFFIQARLASDNTQIVGSFFTDGMPGQFKSLTCGGITKGAVSQAQEVDLKTVTFYWQPTDVSENVIFRATVVRHKAEFWVNVDSPTLQFSNTTSDFSSDTPEYIGSGTRFTSSLLALFVTAFVVVFV